MLRREERHREEPRREERSSKRPRRMHHGYSDVRETRPPDATNSTKHAQYGNVSPQEREQIAAWFAQVDADKSGQIDVRDCVMWREVGLVQGRAMSDGVDFNVRSVCDELMAREQAPQLTSASQGQ